MYKVIYMICDHEHHLNFNQVMSIKPGKVNPHDQLIYFDERDYFVHLSDIVMVVDSDGNKHTENILALLESLK